jgi:5'-nucleotidase
MITPIGSPQSNLFKKAIVPNWLPRTSTNFNGQDNNNKTSIFYINDIHGKSINVERTITASNAFDQYVPSNTDVLKLSSGDIQLGEPLTSNRVMVEAQNIIGIMASAMGNHECDMPEHIADLIPHMGYKLLACNVNIDPQNPLANKIEKSYIQEVNGNKYGIIGISPVDLFSRIKYGKLFEELKIDNIDKTIEDVQKEADNLKKQGVNRIILLSHVGFGYDQRIAKETEGIDIILGGHSHNLVIGAQAGVNLFNSKNGEPVVITQAGRDGRYFGVLNVDWNDKGVMTKIQNNVTSTRGFKRNPVVRHLFEDILGRPKTVGFINSAPPPPINDSIDPSGHANFLCDCMKEDLGTDIALFGSATIRGYFEAGKLDTRWLEDISPFKNKLVVATYNEKELVDMLKASSKSLVNTNNKPGIVHVAGLKYMIGRDGSLRAAIFIDKNGNENQIDINNPRSDKNYSVALTDYYAQGHDGFTMLKKYNQAQKFDYDICECIKKHFAKHPEPVNIVDDGRIQVVD